jgi:ATP-dependent Clp protease ATP-binding subunit ClpC
MNGYNFTDRVRQALRYARNESERLHHEYVGTEHILLGVLREGDGVAAAVLRACKVDSDALRNRLEAAVRPGDPSKRIGPDLPYTSRAKRVLEAAMAEARALGYAYVGTEHLLLALLRSEDQPLADVLADSGLTWEAARTAALGLRGTEGVPSDQLVIPPPLGGDLSGRLPLPRGDRTGRLALLLAVIALIVAVVALGVALRALP